MLDSKVDGASSQREMEVLVLASVCRVVDINLDPDIERAVVEDRLLDRQAGPRPPQIDQTFVLSMKKKKKKKKGEEEEERRGRNRDCMHNVKEYGKGTAAYQLFGNTRGMFFKHLGHELSTNFTS